MTEEIKERDELTAVIIADSFTRSFWPITNDLPKVLMPLCNIPLLEYTLELVIRNNIKKVILFLSSQSPKVLEYIQTQKYRQVSITVISRPACKSLGDVMRELYNKKAIRNDFILFYGDLVGNANLKHAIDQHHKLKDSDKDFILTVVFSEVPIRSNLRIEEEQCVVVLEGQRIMQYDLCSKKKSVKLNTNVKFKDLREFEIRFDLIESGVLICSPEVMNFFSEEFDYHSLRDHLMRDVLTSEIYTSKFSAYVLPKHYYLQRVHVPRSYDGVSVDLMNRWLHPICLDSNLFPPSTPSTYTSSRNNLYKEQNVHLAKGVRIETPAVIGSDTVINEDSLISMSSIGRKCKIGTKCKISNSYIWNNVQIGKNCTISHSIICNGVIIGDNVVVKSGSIVSFNVELNSNQIIEERSRISLYKFNKEEKSYKLSEEQSALGKGFLFDVKLEERLEEVSDHLIRNQSIGAFPEFLEVSSDNSQESDNESSSSEEQVVPKGKFIGKERNFYTDFIEEVKNLVIEMVDRNEDVESMYIEINTLKFSQNKSFLDCISGCIAGLIESCEGSISTHMEKWSELLQKYSSKEEEKLHIMKELERLLIGSNFQKHFHLVIKILYDEDIVEGDTILEWNQSSTNEEIKSLVSSN